MKRWMLCALVFAGCKEKPVVHPPAADFVTTEERARLRCDAPSAMGRSTRTEVCRLLADFEAGTTFTRIPAPGAEAVWFGREFQGQPNQESDVESSTLFFVLYLTGTSAPPPANVLHSYRLPPSAVIPMAAEDLPMSRFANPTSAVAGVERARLDYVRYAALLTSASLGQEVPAAVVDELRGLRVDAITTFPRRGPVVVTRAAGRSLVLRGQLPSARGSTGGFLRMAADGRRALIAEESRAVELWPLR